MKKKDYLIKVTRTYSKVFKITADSREKAERKAVAQEDCVDDTTGWCLSNLECQSVDYNNQ